MKTASAKMFRALKKMDSTIRNWVITMRSFSDVTTWQNRTPDFFLSVTRTQAGFSADETGCVTPMRKYMLPASVTAQTDCEPVETCTSFSLLWSVETTINITRAVRNHSKKIWQSRYFVKNGINHGVQQFQLLPSTSQSAK